MSDLDPFEEKIHLDHDLTPIWGKELDYINARIYPEKEI